MSLDSPEPSLATPYDHVYLATARSTQEEARSRLVARPVLVTADRQTAGRGRGGRTWWPAPRAVAASLALRPRWPQQSWGLIALVAGMAARVALEQPVGLKWPNDLVAGDRKVGGLLTEAAGSDVVIGLGVNLWWPQPPPGAAALLEADPGDGVAAAIAHEWAADVLRRLDGDSADWGRDEYRAACVTLGREITWDSGPEPGRGTARDVDDSGALVVVTEVGAVRLTGGEVQTVRQVRSPADRRATDRGVQ